MKTKGTTTRAPKQVFWVGTPPTNCDCCGVPIGNEFWDGATIYGPWANLSPACHSKIGRGSGLGLGQRYERQADGRFLKVEG